MNPQDNPNMKLQPNQVVMIFDCAVEEHKETGEARLVSCLNDNIGQYNGRYLQRWNVEFLNDPTFTTQRMILAPL